MKPCCLCPSLWLFCWLYSSSPPSLAECSYLLQSPEKDSWHIRSSLSAEDFSVSAAVQCACPEKKRKLTATEFTTECICDMWNDTKASSKPHEYQPVPFCQQQLINHVHKFSLCALWVEDRVELRLVWMKSERKAGWQEEEEEYNEVANWISIRQELWLRRLNGPPKPAGVTFYRFSVFRWTANISIFNFFTFFFHFTYK